MSVFNPYNYAPGANAYQPGPYASGYQMPGTNTGYAIMPNYTGASTAVSTPAARSGNGLANAASLMQSVAGYMDASANARNTVVNAEQSTDDTIRQAVEGRRTSQFAAQLSQNNAERARHERFQALTRNLTRRPEVRANVRPGSAIGRALEFRGNDPQAPSAAPTAPEFNAQQTPGSVNGNRIRTVQR